MRRRGLIFVLTAIVASPSALFAAIIVNPSQPITHRVTVQMIQTALSDGTSPATVFGSAGQRAAIETNVDQIWAQAGIDVLFLPTVNHWNDSFAYQGDGGARPQSDLVTMLSSGDAVGVTNPTSSVINEFFVNIVPGFSLLEENSAAGLANIGRDGTAQFVGDTLLTTVTGREAIVSVVAHEIGHVLGLKHTPDGGANLMSPKGTTEQLTAEQIAAVFQTTFRNDELAFIPSGGTGFPQLLPTLAGDYNGDGTVDAADYTVWRNTLKSTTNLAADGDGDRVVDWDDFVVWKNNYGSGGSGAVILPAIPEPSSLVLVVIIFAVQIGARRRTREGTHNPVR